MNKAEKIANYKRSCKGGLYNRIKYFFLLRRLKKSARQGYDGTTFDDDTITPYMKNRLEKDGFMVKENTKDEKKVEHRAIVYWNKAEADSSKKEKS